MRSNKYSYQTENVTKVVSSENETKDGGEKASASHDFRVAQEITLGIVEHFITEGNKSLGDKEISNGYKYFCKRYVTNITSMLKYLVSLFLCTKTHIINITFVNSKRNCVC